MASERAKPLAQFGQLTNPKPLILLSTFGTGGDVQPFLSLAQGLQNRGHRTLLIVPRFHEKMVQETRLDYVAFGASEHSSAVLDDPDLWDERKGFGVVWRGLLRGLDELYDWMMAQAQTAPCVVLSHPFLTPVAAMARAQRPNLRIVSAYLAPSSLRTVHDPLTIGSLNIAPWVPLAFRRVLWRSIDRFGIDPDLLPGLNAARVARGLMPVASFLAHMESVGDASVGLFPSWFASRQPDWPPTFVQGDFPMRPMPALQSLPTDLEEFLAGGDAPIAFTPGTGHKHAAGYFSNALRALQSLGKRGLFITTHPGQVPHPLPPDVRWQPYAPFDILLPRVAMLVHHGGIGTTAEALRAGIPQLILPCAFDQFDNGRRAQRLGAGQVLLPSQANARGLSRAIANLLARTTEPTEPRRLYPLGADGCLERLLDTVELTLVAPRP